MEGVLSSPKLTLHGVIIGLVVIVDDHGVHAGIKVVQGVVAVLDHGAAVVLDHGSAVMFDHGTSIMLDHGACKINQISVHQHYVHVRNMQCCFGS